MKMVIVAAAMSAVFMSGTANAQSFSESCGHLDNPTRFNPTELSAYLECWLDYHKPDEAAGVIGSVFYARAGEEFISMPVSTLRNAGSTEAAKRVVMGAIVDAAYAGQLAEARDEIAALKDARDALVEAGVTQATIDDLNGRIDALEAAQLIGEIRYATAQAAFTAGAGSVDITSNDEAVRMAARDAALRFEGRVWSDANAIYDLGQGRFLDAISNHLFPGQPENRIVDMRDQLEAGQLTIAQFISNVADIVTEQARAAVTLVTAENAPDHTFAGAAFTNATATETLVGDTHDVVDGDGHVAITFTTHAAASSYILRNGLSQTHSVVGRSLDTWSASVNGSTITFADSLMVPTLVAQAVEAAYNVGYDDGYNEGYADGYRDGFADGVASVR